MSLVSLTITHAAGTRTLPLYVTPARTRSFAITAESVRGATRQSRVIGDRLENPSPLAVSVYVQEATLPASYALAYVVIDECESASRVAYHEGVVEVDGILSASVTPDGLGVRLLLSFAPTRAAFEPLLTADNTTILTDSTLITADATVFP